MEVEDWTKNLGHEKAPSTGRTCQDKDKNRTCSYTVTASEPLVALQAVKG